MATIIKGSTKRGQNLITRSNNYEGVYLESVYENYSIYKRNAWDYCYNKYVNTPENSNFHICSHNSMVFTIAWYGKHGDENAVFIETRDNSYIVLLDK